MTALFPSTNGGKSCEQTFHYMADRVCRDFLLFIPASEPGLGAIMSYYTNDLKLSAEGDVIIGSDSKIGLGITHKLLSTVFGFYYIILSPPIRHRPPDHQASIGSAPVVAVREKTPEVPVAEERGSQQATDMSLLEQTQSTATGVLSRLTDFLPGSGYFVAGGISGIVSRTSTAPLDRLKVYLIAQTDATGKAVAAAKGGDAVQATKHAARPLINACKELWRAGGIRSLFAGKQHNLRFWLDTKYSRQWT